MTKGLCLHDSCLPRYDHELTDKRIADIQRDSMFLSPIVTLDTML